MCKRAVLRTLPLANLLIFAWSAWAQFSPTVNAPSGSSPFPAGPFPIAIVSADFNSDTIPDLAIANQINDTVTILLGDGKGGFQIATTGTFSTGKYPTAMALGDFNNDGKVDLAVANIGDNTITILLGDGAGGFSAVSNSPTVGSGPNSIVVANFNGDKNLDLAVSNLNDKSVTVLFGNGDGTFQAQVTTVPVGTNPSCVATGDFNGDKIPDLAVSNETDGTVSVFTGDGAGHFTQVPGSPFTVVAEPTSLTAVDFNLDGYTDLAVASLHPNPNSTSFSSTGTLTVLEGNGSGGFTPYPGSPYNSGTEPIAIAVGDFNEDGYPDIAVANYRSNNVSALLFSSTSTTAAFAAAVGSPYAAGGLPHSIAVADFNGDGKPDLAVANYNDGTVTILLNTFSSSPMMVSSASGTAPVAPSSLVTIFGTGLASTATLPGPNSVPTTLDNTSVMLTDATGAKSPLQINYVSPTQINAVIPAVPTGAATFSISTALGLQNGSVTINSVAPGLFSANENGKGPAVGQFFSDLLNTSFMSTFSCATTPCTPVPIGVSTGDAVLVLYGTGIRNRATLASVTLTVGGQSLPVFYAGESPSSPGLDQINAALPPTLAGSGLVYVSVTIGSATSNQVTLDIL